MGKAWDKNGAASFLPKKNYNDLSNINTIHGKKEFYSYNNESKNCIKLKNPKEYYYDIYKKARIKAKQIKDQAIQAELEANGIKTKYMLEDIDSSENEE
jgi:hypothetical protein